MKYRFTWKTLGVLVLMAAGVGLEAPHVSAQREPSAGLDGATAAIYRGECDAPLDSPLYELGTLEHRTVVDFTDAATTAGREESLPDELLHLGEDRDADGVLDVGEDLNDNGTLDTGIDTNASGTLDDEEIIPKSALMVGNIPEVWMVEHAVDDPFALLDEGLVMAVHQISGNQRQLIACGRLGDGLAEDWERFYVTLEPIGNANYRGYATLVFETLEHDEQEIRVTMFETLLDGNESQQQETLATPAS